MSVAFVMITSWEKYTVFVHKGLWTLLVLTGKNVLHISGRTNWSSENDSGLSEAHFRGDAWTAFGQWWLCLWGATSSRDEIQHISSFSSFFKVILKHTHVYLPTTISINPVDVLLIINLCIRLCQRLLVVSMRTLTLLNIIRVSVGSHSVTAAETHRSLYPSSQKMALIQWEVTGEIQEPGESCH